MLNQQDAMILIIDIQDKLLNATFNRDTIALKSQIVSKTSSILNLPVIATEQYPKGLGSTVCDVKDFLNNNTLFFEKNAFSALESLEIFEAIKKYGKKQVIVFGIETHICVSQTVQALLQNGFEVYVVKDACGSRSEIEHSAGIEYMRDCGAKIVTTEIMLFEFLKGSKHEKFKEIQSLIK